MGPSTATTLRRGAASMGFTEVNQTTLTSARWADLNANGFAGNVLIIAATSPDDYFKIEQLVVNSASVSAPPTSPSVTGCGTTPT